MGCKGSHAAGTCGCSGSCSSGACAGTKELADYKPSDEIARLPYETLYVRCQCGAVGFTPETWKEIGTSLLTAGGKHYPLNTVSEWRCEPYTTLVGDDRFKSDELWTTCHSNIIRGGSK